MNKNILRKTYLKVRTDINKENRQRKDCKIFEEIINLPEYIKCKLLLIYVSTDGEVDTLKLIEHSIKEGKEVAVPKCEGDIINFYYIKSLQELEKGYFGILEPVNKNIVTNFENSICIVPGICFDKKRNRIGYGKGYYDRFLSNYYGLKIGLTYKECICDKIDIDKYDIELDNVIFN